jgi:hypothetical protein
VFPYSSRQPTSILLVVRYGKWFVCSSKIEDIEPSGADEREAVAALTTKLLLNVAIESVGIPDTIVFAIIGIAFKGNGRLLKTQDIVPFLLCCREFGIKETWTAAVRHRFFRHIDQPILPNLRLDLNSMTQNDCKV